MTEPEDAGSVVINGTPELLEPGTTVADLVERLAGDPSARGVAAAVNGSVVPRGRWRLLPLEDGDRVEILTAVQGG
ncbi:MAG: sulfur carrier protein ThiS [Sporichthyaceae bacterium]